jgi:hypothetical protein
MKADGRQILDAPLGGASPKIRLPVRKVKSNMGSLLSPAGSPRTARSLGVIATTGANNGELRNREHFYRELLEALPSSSRRVQTFAR